MNKSVSFCLFLFIWKQNLITLFVTHVAYSWSSFSTKCRDAVSGQAFPGVTLCDAENSHPLKPSGLGCLHMNEPGFFSVMQMARQPSFLANEGKRFHCAQRRRLPQGNVAPGFAPATGTGRDMHGHCPTPVTFWPAPATTTLGAFPAKHQEITCCFHTVWSNWFPQVQMANQSRHLGTRTREEGTVSLKRLLFGNLCFQDCNNSHFFYDGCWGVHLPPLLIKVTKTLPFHYCTFIFLR